MKWWILLFFSSFFPWGVLYSHSCARLHASSPCENWQSAGRAGTGTVTKAVEQSRNWGLLFLSLSSGCQLCSRGWVELREYSHFSCYMQQTLLRGHGSRVSPASYVVFKILQREKNKKQKTSTQGEKKHMERRKSQVGKNILKKHFEMPLSIFTNGPRHSQGQRTWPGPSGGPVKDFMLHSLRAIYSPDEYN